MKVVLTGYRGTGKTTVGRLVADRLGLPFHDTDALVEARAGRPIPAIFAAEGEAGFRALEREVCAGLAGTEGVIATGGGAVLDAGNVEALRRGARVFLLEGSPEELARRCATGDRPALTTLPPLEEIRTVLAARRDAYRAAADHCVWTGCRTPDEVAGQVMAALAARPSDEIRAELAALNPYPGRGGGRRRSARRRRPPLRCGRPSHRPQPVARALRPALRAVRPPLRLHAYRLRRPRRGPPARGPPRPPWSLGHAPAQGGDAPVTATPSRPTRPPSGP